MGGILSKKKKGFVAPPPPESHYAQVQAAADRELARLQQEGQARREAEAAAVARAEEANAQLAAMQREMQAAQAQFSSQLAKLRDATARGEREALDRQRRIESRLQAAREASDRQVRELTAATEAALSEARRMRQESAKRDAEKLRLEAEIQQRRALHLKRLIEDQSFTRDQYNFAVVGDSGVGKSSFICAKLCLEPNKPGAPVVGAGVETTLKSTKFVDPLMPYVAIFDIPGAGTRSHPIPTYFTDHSLGEFDMLLLLFHPRWSTTCDAVLREAVTGNQHVACVYTNTQTDIDNMVRSSRGSMTPAQAEATLRQKVTERLSEDIAKSNIELAAAAAAKGAAPPPTIPAQKVFFIDSLELLEGRARFDELSLLRAMFNAAAPRRANRGGTTADMVWERIEATAQERRSEEDPAGAGSADRASGWKADLAPKLTNAVRRLGPTFSGRPTATTYPK